MKLNIPNIIEKIELKDYAPEMEEGEIWVWVNPTRKLVDFMLGTIRQGKASGEEIYEWLAEIWSQGEEKSRWSKKEVEQLAGELMDRDPRLWSWLIKETGRLILEHRGLKKKSLISKPSSSDAE